MSRLSTEQVAKKLGIGKSSLSRYILAGKVPAPLETMAGGIRLRLWSEQDIERLREVLPKIANGRKTRYQKQRKKQKTRKAKPLRTGSQAKTPTKRPTRTVIIGSNSRPARS